MVDTVVEVMHAEYDRLIRTTFHKLNVKVWLGFILQAANTILALDSTLTINCIIIIYS